MTNPVLDDQHMDQVVHEWLRDDDERTPDRVEQVSHIMDRVDATKQRRRWWPLSPFGRSAMHSAESGDRRVEASGAPCRSSPVFVIATLAVLIVGGSLLFYTAGQTLPPVGAPGADTTTIEPLDEIIALNQQAWNEDADLVREVYAPDAVHTATFYDRTNEYEGVEAIVAIAGMGGTINAVAPRVDIPAAAGYRWADFSDFAGGMVCLWRAFDGHIKRHDCLLSANSSGIRPAAGLADGSDAAAIDELLERLTPAWGGDLEALEAVYAPDAVHTARYLNRTMRYEGPEAIHAVARNGGPFDLIGDRVEFEAPEGELAWAQANNTMGGTVCLFRAREGMITRHDCLLPVAG